MGKHFTDFGIFAPKHFADFGKIRLKYFADFGKTLIFAHINH